MATAQLQRAARNIFDRVRPAAEHPDGDLLDRYRTGRDPAAFTGLVRRHGPMVLGVCRRVLRDHHAAEDAFQATFLVLAKRANAVRPPGLLGAWLHGVAYRTALKARGRAYRRGQVEREYLTRNAAVAGPPCEPDDLRPLLDEQLAALPDKYRLPLVLCGVQGLNKAEAAERLGLPEGTVSSRLARGRDLLRDRLTRRGVVVPAAAVVALSPAGLSAAVPPALAATAAQSAVGFAAGAAVSLSPCVLSTAQEVLRAMTLIKLKLLSAVAATAVLVGGTAGTFALNAQEKVKPAAAPAKPGEKPVKPDGEKPKPAPDGEKGKEAKKPGRVGGTVSAVDAKAGTVTITRGGDGPKNEQVVKLAADAKVVVDGKPAKLADVPKGVQAEVFVPEGSTDAAGLMAFGPRVAGVVAKVDGSTFTLDVKGNESGAAPTYTVPKDVAVMIDGKPGTAADLKPGLRVGVQVAVDGKTVLAVKAGAEGGPKGQRVGGRVSAVDAAAGTLTLTAKGEGGPKETVVKLAADAKVLVDGREVKLAAVPKTDAVFAEVMLAAGGKDAVEVRVSGMRFVGTVKSVDGSGLTLAGEKAERVVKLAAGGKVAVNGKPAALADIKPGDKVAVQMAADDSGALVILAGGEKGAPDKPKKPGGDKE